MRKGEYLFAGCIEKFVRAYDSKFRCVLSFIDHSFSLTKQNGEVNIVGFLQWNHYSTVIQYLNSIVIFDSLSCHQNIIKESKRIFGEAAIDYDIKYISLSTQNDGYSCGAHLAANTITLYNLGEEECKKLVLSITKNEHDIYQHLISQHLNEITQYVDEHRNEIITNKFEEIKKDNLKFVTAQTSWYKKRFARELESWNNKKELALEIPFQNLDEDILYCEKYSGMFSEKICLGINEKYQKSLYNITNPKVLWLFLDKKQREEIIKQKYVYTVLPQSFSDNDKREIINYYYTSNSDNSLANKLIDFLNFDDKKQILKKIKPDLFEEFMNEIKDLHVFNSGNTKIVQQKVDKIYDEILNIENSNILLYEKNDNMNQVLKEYSEMHKNNLSIQNSNTNNNLVEPVISKNLNDINFKEEDSVKVNNSHVKKNATNNIDEYWLYLLVGFVILIITCYIVKTVDVVDWSHTESANSIKDNKNHIDDIEV